MDGQQQARAAMDAVLHRFAAVLGPVVESELRPRYGQAADWLAKATSGPGRRNATASIEDPSDVLSAMIGTWDTVWSRRALRRETRSHLHEMKALRHRWAHHQPLDLDDAHRLADTAARVLKSLGLDEEAAQLRGLGPSTPASLPAPPPAPSAASTPQASTVAPQTPPPAVEDAAPAPSTTQAETDPPPAAVPLVTDPQLRSLHTDATRLVQGIEETRVALNWASGPEDRPAIGRQLERWGDQLHAVRRAATSVPPVRLTLLGGTGAGKSTLINAVLGEPALASSNNRACTSAAIEVSYDPAAYGADVHFIERSAWQEELEHYIEELSGGREAGDEAPLTPGGEVDRKLRALFGDDPVEAFSASLDPAALVEPAALTEALDAGRRQLAASTGDELRKQLKEYVTSFGQLWPLVKLVRIHGPFEALSAGGVLVDLPGLNDPNAAREAVTRSYLDTSEYVWVVFDMRRALNRDVTDALKERDLFRRLVMEGREGALVFIGTRSDQIDLHNDPEEFGLDEDTPVEQIAAARNAHTVETVREQVRDLVQELERASDREATQLRGAVDRFPVFTTSPQNLLVLRGQMRSANTPLFSDPAATQIPALVEHLQATAGDGHRQRHVDRLRAQLSEVVDELDAALTSARSGKALGELHDRGGRLASAAAESTTELNATLRAAQGQLRDALAASRAAFTAELAEGVDRATRGAERRIAADIDRYHWSTLRCACRDGGTFFSSTAGKVELTKDVGRPLFESMAISWAEFFGERLRADITAQRTQVEAALEDYRTSVLEAVPRVIRDDHTTSQAVTALHEGAVASVQHGVDSMTGEVEGYVEHARRELLHLLDEVLAERMQEAYGLAAHERGHGTKARIVERIAQAGQQCLALVGPDVVDSIATGLEDVIEWTAARFADLADDAAERTAAVVERLEAAADERQQQIDRAWREHLEVLVAIMSDGPGVPARCSA